MAAGDVVVCMPDVFAAQAEDGGDELAGALLAAERAADREDAALGVSPLSSLLSESRKTSAELVVAAAVSASGVLASELQVLGMRSAAEDLFTLTWSLRK